MKDYQNIDDYLQTFPIDIQKILKKVRSTIKKAAPNAEEDIKYNIPTFKLNNKNLVHFGGFKNHIGFYPTPGIFTPFKKELSIYESGKGSVKFPLDKPIPYDLIAKIVKFRAKEMI
ncbi:DUF1801 domain-containing protein [soil metagenome]